MYIKDSIIYLFVCIVCLTWDAILFKGVIHLIQTRDNWMWVLLMVFIFVPRMCYKEEKEEENKIIT